MTSSSETISDRAELLTWLEVEGAEGVAQWFDEHSDLADSAEVEEIEGRLNVVLFGAGLWHRVEFTYPFTRAQVAASLDWADTRFDAAYAAGVLGEDDALLGVPHIDGDVTQQLALLLGGPTVQSICAAIGGGEWQRLFSTVEQGWDGDPIMAWFMPSDDRMIGLGVSPDALFVVPLLGSDEDGYWVEEWPEPTVILPWNHHHHDEEQPLDPGELVDALAAAVDQVMSTQVGGVEEVGEEASDIDLPLDVSTPGNRHDVRLATKGMPLSRVDLDFTVKRGRQTLGTLSISRGGLLWRPSGSAHRRGKGKAGIHISWQEFKEWAEL